MEMLKDLNNISVKDDWNISAEQAVTTGYLDITTAVQHLDNIGIKVSPLLLQRYVDEGAIIAYGWLPASKNNLCVGHVTLMKEFDKLSRTTGLNTNRLLIAEKGFSEIKDCSFYFNEDPKGTAIKDGRIGCVVASIWSAKSLVRNGFSDEKEVVVWSPLDWEFLSLLFFKVSDLNELATRTASSMREIEDAKQSIRKSCSSDLHEKIHQLEEENKLLKAQAGDEPAGSVYVALGAVLQLLTEQKIPSRNQSGIKIELEAMDLSGLSKGSLNNNFRDANKAFNAAKALKGLETSKYKG